MNILYPMLGCILGIFSGLLPGMHVNLLVSLSFMIPGTGLSIASMLFTLGVVHTFLDFIPDKLYSSMTRNHAFQIGSE